MPRVNFEQLNNIYKRLSLKPTEKEFAIAASRFWLSQTEDRRGHTCAPELKVKEEASRLSNLSIEKILNSSGDLISGNYANFMNDINRGGDGI